MKRALFLLLTIILLPLFLSGNSFAWEFEIAGDVSARGNIQQTMSIRTHEDMRDVRYSSFRTSIRGEALYETIDTQTTKLQFYVLANYYYDEVLGLHSPARHAIRNEAGSDYYRDFERPRDSEEWLTELYAELKYKDIKIKVGKQLVSWGETAESQVADVINPLDLKYMLAFPDWEDFKIGLWMISLFYTPENVWQDLSFELVYIPFDFEETRYPPAGSGMFFGGPPMANYVMQKIFDKQRHDAPSDGADTFEIGLRIKGYTDIGEGVDWAISHFYTRLDTPLIDGQKGYSRLLKMMLGGKPGGKIYTYPNYNSTAISFATTWDLIGAAVRGECAYNTNRDYQYGASDIKEKDVIATALTFNRATMVPYLSQWNHETSVSVNFTWYNYWLLNHEYDKSTGDYIKGETGKDSTRTKFTLGLSTGFWFYRIITMLNLVYDTNGNTTIMGGVVLAPGDHWNLSCIYQQINEMGAARYQDQVTLSFRYEFW